MKKTTLSLLVAGLCSAAPAVQAQMQVTGSVTPGFIYSDFSGDNKFRFNEYRDMRSGGTLGADIRGESAKNYLRFFGENIGRDDQFMELKGGAYGVYKWSVYNNDIVHNLTSNAKTPFNFPNSTDLTFTGTGGTAAGQALQVTAARTPANAFLNNVNNWNKFDYGIKHENYGGTFELQSSAASPWYVRATANQKYTNGLRPVGQAGSSPGGPSFELPAVVDYTTTDVSVEGGYTTRTSQYAVVASWSRFEDNNNFMRWRNPLLNTATNNVETMTLAANSDLWKIAGNAMWKALPMDSTLALRGTYSRTTSGLPLATTGIDVGSTTIPPTNAGQLVNFNNNQTNFNGKNSNTSLSASLTSALAKSLDSRVYYNYTDRRNNSTEVVSTPINTVSAGSTQACDTNPVTGAALTTCSNELFHYRKNNFGVDLNWRVAQGHKLSGGWDWVDTKRERIDYDKTTDNKLYVEYKNSVFDTVTGKIKYQYLDRDSDNQLSSLNPALSTNNFYNFYQSRFDLAGNKQNLLKFVIDATPIELLDLGAELRFKDNDYKNVTFGRKKDSRDEIYLTAGYGDARVFRVSSFFDYETSRYDSAHYVGTPAAGATVPISTGSSLYYYDAKVKDHNWVFGIAADWLPTERWKVKAAYIWQKTTGGVDQFPAIGGVIYTNIPNYDNFRRNTFNLNGTYLAAKNWDVNFGYSYESYKYSDAQMDNYNFVPISATGTASVLSVLSGAYANPTYHANIVYGYLKYKFE